RDGPPIVMGRAGPPRRMKCGKVSPRPPAELISEQTPQPSERPGEAVPLLWIAPARGGPDMAPQTPPAFGASRRSRAAPLDRASPWGPEMAPQTPQPSERPGEAGSLL